MPIKAIVAAFDTNAKSEAPAAIIYAGQSMAEAQEAAKAAAASAQYARVEVYPYPRCGKVYRIRQGVASTSQPDDETPPDEAEGPAPKRRGRKRKQTEEAAD